MAGAEEIRDRKSFEKYLGNLSQEFAANQAPVLAARAASRVIPLDGRTLLVQASESDLLAVFRSNLIAYVMLRNKSFRFPKRTIHLEDKSPYVKVALLSERTVHEVAFASECCEVGARVASFGSVAGLQVETALMTILTGGSNRTKAAQKASRVRRIAKATKGAEERFWFEITNDAYAFSKGLDAAEVAKLPLWSETVSWVERAIFELNKRLETLHESTRYWSVWSQWYKSVLAGENAFGLAIAKDAEAVTESIVLGGRDGLYHPEFWSREPGEINREIAEWVAEARAAEVVSIATAKDANQLDLSSRPASVRTTTAMGKVVEEVDQPHADIQRDLLAAAVKDLQSGLKRLGILARQKNAPEAFLNYLDAAATVVEAAHIDQSKLFESGRSLETLKIYGSTVAEEWDSFSAAQYHALVLQFNEVISKFPDWRTFKANPPKAVAGTKAEEVADAVDEVAEVVSQHGDIFAASIGHKLKALVYNLKSAVRRAADQIASSSVGHVATELLMSDAAQSVANTLMSLVKLGLEKVVPIASQVFDKISEGAGQGVVNLVGLIIPILGLMAIPRLAKMFPGVFDMLKAGAKILRDINKDE